MPSRPRVSVVRAGAAGENTDLSSTGSAKYGFARSGERRAGRVLARTAVKPTLIPILHGLSGETMVRLNCTCRCGGVRWAVEETSPRNGIRYICHCDDCQVYAQYLGSAREKLDAHGGTDAYQLPASQIELQTGKNLLACVQVTRRPLLRWYCGQCRTAVANTYHTSKLSFVSLPLGPKQDAERDRVLGPPSGHAWTKFGWGDLSKVKQVNIPAMLWRIGSRIISARLSGDFRANPFFDRATAQPVATPLRLTQKQRAELDEQVRFVSSTA